MWYKDGSQLKGDFRIETRHDGQLNMLNISKSVLSDLGKYSVNFDDDDCILEANVDIKGGFAETLIR